MKNINGLSVKDRLPSFVVWTLYILFSLSVIMFFVPANPRMPMSGLDPSWEYGINQAVSQGLVFGQDIVFTMGPYGFLYTHLYHPDTDVYMMAFSFLLVIGFIVCVFVLIPKEQPGWFLLFGVMFLFIDKREAFLFSMPLVVVLVAYKLSINLFYPNFPTPHRRDWFAFFFGLTLLGILPLIKGTQIFLVAFFCILSSTLFLMSRKWWQAFLSLIAPLVFMIASWLVIGQPLSALYNYFFTLQPIIAGYSEAMATLGGWRDFFLFALGIMLILFALHSEKKSSFKSFSVLFVVFVVFFFVLYKSGFVRHNNNSRIITISDALLILSFLFFVWYRKLKVILLLEILLWLYVGWMYRFNEPTYIKQIGASRIENFLSGVWIRIATPEHLREKYDDSRSFILGEFDAPELEGTTDVYGRNQSFLIASDNTWAPRPVFQSYAVYTPELALLNEEYIRGEDAPDNILFAIEPIDGRFPAMEDGYSWLSITDNYAPRQYIHPYLLLEKRNVPISTSTPLQNEIIYSQNHQFRSPITLPKGAPLMAEIHMEMNWPGKFFSLLYKPPLLQMQVELEDGSIKEYRIIPGMIETPFLISPVVTSADEFLELNGELDSLQGKLVNSIEIYPVSPFGDSFWVDRLWKPSFVLTLREVEFPDKAVMTDFEFSDILESPPYFEVSTGACDGNIDFIDNHHTSTELINASGFMLVTGWLSSDLNNGLTADEIFITLSDDGDRILFIETEIMSRMDVVEYFSQPNLLQSGYFSLSDVSELYGDYQLGLAYVQDRVLIQCENFIVPVSIR